jgi:hypothetical protein
MTFNVSPGVTLNVPLTNAPGPPGFGVAPPPPAPHMVTVIEVVPTGTVYVWSEPVYVKIFVPVKAPLTIAFAV